MRTLPMEAPRFIFLLVLLAALSSSAAVELVPWLDDLDLYSDEPILWQGQLQEDYYNYEGNRPLWIRSPNLAVIVNRLTAGRSYWNNPPIQNTLVIVKTSGPQCGLETITFRVEEIFQNDTSNIGATTQLTIEAYGSNIEGATTKDINFLESSRIEAHYPCGGRLCQPTPSPTNASDPNSDTTPKPTALPSSANPKTIQPKNSSFNASLQTKDVTSNASARARLIVVTTVVLLLTACWMTDAISLYTTIRSPRAVALCAVVPLIAAALWGHPSLTSRRLQAEQQPCQIQVEIVYHGCHRQVIVTAPAMQLRNMDLWQMSENCQCHDAYDFRNPDSNFTTDWLNQGINNTITSVVVGGENAELIPQAESSGCFIAIGRPFRDDSDRVVSASVASSSENPEWSASESQDIPESLTNGMKKYKSDLASEWINRALGEHASIASFAAFTIALMTNQAPPDLIRDSLQAAQEELRHAKVSFEMASLLSGTTVEPSALPPSTLSFDKNLTALALGAAREGCIEETISALKMAAAVDATVLDSSTEDLVFLAEQTRSIALEEAGHSALAWRTVRWVCSNDPDACGVIKAHILNQEALSQAALGRFDKDSEAARGWECIYQTYLTQPFTTDKPVRFPASCQFESSSLVSLVVESVVRTFLEDLHDVPE